MLDVFVPSLALLCLVGWWAGRRVDTASDFVLAGRDLPVWAVVLSFGAAEVSAMTVIGVPAVAYGENWQFLQFFIASACARLAVAFLFIPAFYRDGCVTVYEYLGRRFGPATRTGAAALFFLTRLFAASVRLMVVCAIASAFLGWSLEALLLLFSAVGIGYVVWGGVRSAVWAGAFQTAFILVAGAMLLGFLVSSVDGGAIEALRLAENAGRLELWKWGPGESGWLKGALTDPNIVWLAVLTGSFGSLAAFGTDHEMMQRLLTVKTRLGSQKAVILTMLLSFAVLVLYLSVGTGLFAFYDQHPEMALPSGSDRVLPHFAMQILPPLYKGLLLTAVALASVDLPLAGAGAVFLNDIYRPLFGGRADERRDLRVARVSAGVFGLLLAMAAYLLSVREGWLWLAFKVGGVTYGPLLGTFLYGLLTKRRAGRAAACSMASVTVLSLALLTLSETGALTLGWHWLPLLGAVATAGLTHALARVLDRSDFARN